MIDSKIIKINKNDVRLDNIAIESYLNSLGYDIIRWAIVSTTEETLTLSVSYNVN